MNTILPAAVVLALVVALTRTMEANTLTFPWVTINEALDQAPKSGRLIVLDVYTDWCGWCKRMDRDTYADSSVAAYIAEHCIAAKMNPEKKGTVKYDGKEFTQAEFGQAMGVTGYPATAFFSGSGELITVIPGYIPASDFRLLLQFLAEDHYKTQSFEDYRKANG